MIGKIFRYDNVRIDESRQVISFDYSVETDEKSFALTETLKLPTALPSSNTVDRLLKTLHLALGISYYKTFIPPEIDHAYTMDDDEAVFWNSIFANGLGEFLYKNDLKSEQLARFSVVSGSVNAGEGDDIAWNSTSLLGIGGGKDSIIAGEILKELKIPTTGFVLATGENRGQAQAVADKMGIEMLGVERQIDSQILEMNKLEGAYNGHVPISLVFALVGCLLACIKSSKYVVVANEASASIPHVSYHGNEINHQWSKSLEFEKQFQGFISKNISSELCYTSLIRPLTSVAVAKLFAGYPIYFETFTSDNSLFKIKQEARSHPRWSDDSPKSLSSFILLSPWLTDEDTVRIFGKDFLNEPDLKSLFFALLGRSDKPVLDCVGTPDELRLSLSMLAKQNRFGECALMILAKNENLLLANFDEPLKAALDLSDDHALPETLRGRVLSLLRDKIA